MYGKNDKWGEVDGDINAKAIMSDRKDAKKTQEWVNWIVALPLFGSFFWFGSTGSHWALACLIMSAVWAVGSAVITELFPIYTMLLITERRTQLLEHDMNALAEQLEKAEYRLKTGHNT